VVPLEFGADQVFVPAAVQGGSLVRNVTHTSTFTPNRDGANDDYELSFTLVKTRAQPRVRIFSLSGSQVAELASSDAQSSRQRYVWDGTSGGQIVPPGVYLMIVEVETDARKETVQKLVHVVY
jgi:gliding motility-associated-like protein